MIDRASYPADLAAFIRDAWEADAPPLPPQLEDFLSSAYQATLLRDEEREVTFRLVLAKPETFPPNAGPPRGMLRLVFDRPRPFDASELRLLSPAAKYARALLGVMPTSDGFQIWGIVHSGPRWLERIQGGRALPPEIAGSPLVVRASGPGLLSVGRGDRTIAELRGGIITRPGMDVFASRWFPARFASVREELYGLHEQARASAEEPWGELDRDLVRILSVHMVKRLIATMRASRHGGAIVLVPPDVHIERYVHLKYAFREEEPRRRHRTLVLAAMRALARSAASEEPLGHTRVAGWKDYANQTRDPFPGLDEAIFEFSHLIAALADVDGAVVMSTRWEVLGFSAEIVGELPEVSRVAVARDLEGTERTLESVDGVGTRHRSAYRFCAAVHDAMAIVVSQDGTIRWIAWHEGEVTCWNHVPSDASDD